MLAATTTQVSWNTFFCSMKCWLTLADGQAAHRTTLALVIQHLYKLVSHPKSYDWHNKLHWVSWPCSICLPSTPQLCLESKKSHFELFTECNQTTVSLPVFGTSPLLSLPLVCAPGTRATSLAISAFRWSICSITTSTSACAQPLDAAWDCRLLQRSSNKCFSKQEIAYA